MKDIIENTQLEDTELKLASQDAQDRMRERIAEWNERVAARAERIAERNDATTFVSEFDDGEDMDEVEPLEELLLDEPIVIDPNDTGPIPDQSYRLGRPLREGGVVLSTWGGNTIQYCVVRKSMLPQDVITYSYTQTWMKEREDAMEAADSGCGGNNCAEFQETVADGGSTQLQIGQLLELFGFTEPTFLLRFPKADRITDARQTADIAELEFTAKMAMNGIGPSIAIAFQKRFELEPGFSQTRFVDIWIYGYQDNWSSLEDFDTASSRNYNAGDAARMLDLFNRLSNTRMLLLDMKPENAIVHYDPQTDSHEFRFIDFDDYYAKDLVPTDVTNDCIFVLNATLMLNSTLESGNGNLYAQERWRLLFNDVFERLMELTQPDDGVPPAVEQSTMCNFLFSWTEERGTRPYREGNISNQLRHAIGTIMKQTVYAYGNMEYEKSEKRRLVFQDKSKSFLHSLLYYIGSYFPKASPP